MKDHWVAEVVILCEDLVSFNLLRRYVLRAFGKRTRIVNRVAPQGRGAGEKYVRNNFVKEVEALRRCHRASLKSTVLLVHMDADVHAVRKAQQELAEELRRAKVAARDQAEPIAVVIPKRNIETWIHGLSGMAVNENDDYSKQPREGIRSPAC